MDNVQFYYNYQAWESGFTPSPEFYQRLMYLEEVYDRADQAFEEGLIGIDAHAKIVGEKS